LKYFTGKLNCVEKLFFQWWGKNFVKKCRRSCFPSENEITIFVVINLFEMVFQEKALNDLNKKQLMRLMFVQGQDRKILTNYL
jgi:hypothetical protein